MQRNIIREGGWHPGIGPSRPFESGKRCKVPKVPRRWVIARWVDFSTNEERIKIHVPRSRVRFMLIKVTQLMAKARWNIFKMNHESARCLIPTSLISEYSIPATTNRETSLPNDIGLPIQRERYVYRRSAE
jgi:hypothetical protein